MAIGSATLTRKSSVHFKMKPLDRPPCPDCGMALITVAKSADCAGNAHRVFECLRCGLVETTTDQSDREQELQQRA